jgi:hypothetical protein
MDTYLATFTWKRKVGKNGQICLGGHHRYYLFGRAHARKEILIRFDPLDRCFVFFDPESFHVPQTAEQVTEAAAREFARLADAAGCSEDRLLEAARRMIDRRQMRRYAAVKFFLFTFSGSVFTLATIIYIGVRFQTLDIGYLLHMLPRQAGSTELLWISLGFLAGFAVKVPLFPVHTWLPLAHTEAPTAGSVILAGVLALIAGIHTLQSLGILPWAIGPFSVRAFSLFNAFMWGLLVWVYIWLIQMLWKVDPQAWLFLAVITVFNLILDFTMNLRVISVIAITIMEL